MSEGAKPQARVPLGVLWAMLGVGLEPPKKAPPGNGKPGLPRRKKTKARGPTARRYAAGVQRPHDARREARPQLTADRFRWLKSVLARAEAR